MSTLLICQKMSKYKLGKNIRVQKKDNNWTINSSLVSLWKVYSFQDFQFDYFILIWLSILLLLTSWVFVRMVVIFTDYTLQHLLCHQKFTYHHCIGFLNENNFVSYCLYVTFSFYTMLYHFLVSFRRFSERK